MKNYKICLLILLSLFFGINFSFGYSQQGFSQYQEGEDGISFSCVNQCAITLGQKDKIDYLNLDGTVKGNGIIGYGFLIGDQISLVNQYDITVSSQINDYMNFIEYKQYLSSIPGNTDLLVLVNGNVNGNLKLDSGKFSFGQKISQGWKDFRTFDSFKPYTINLLYGPMVNGENFNKGFYIMFLIFCVIIFFTKKSKKNKLKALLICLLSLRLIYDLRMGLEGINYYRDDIKDYITKDKYEKLYRDRGDFYSFIDFAGDKLKSEGVNDFEKIGFFTDNTRPFPGSMKYFLYPYRIVMNEDVGKYIIVYQSSNVEIMDDNKIRINNKEINGLMVKYREYAFMFIKNN